jgi:L-threonylcarbamoyladenylate synthase
VKIDGTTPNAIALAAARLADGDLVAFPTETVYGLGARADDDAAVAKIFAAKGRPVDHPLIVHVADARAAAAFVSDLPLAASRWCFRAVRAWPTQLRAATPPSRCVAPRTPWPKLC